MVFVKLSECQAVKRGMTIQNITSSEEALKRLTAADFEEAFNDILSSYVIKKVEWNFVDYPGYQFCKDKSHD